MDTKEFKKTVLKIDRGSIPLTSMGKSPWINFRSSESVKDVLSQEHRPSSTGGKKKETTRGEHLRGESPLGGTEKPEGESAPQTRRYKVDWTRKRRRLEIRDIEEGERPVEQKSRPDKLGEEI